MLCYVCVVDSEPTNLETTMKSVTQTAYIIKRNELGALRELMRDARGSLANIPAHQTLQARECLRLAIDIIDGVYVGISPAVLRAISSQTVTNLD